MKKKLSIIIPCYNESKNIPLILKRFNDVIKRDDIEVVMVDNGSTDGSEQVLKKMLSNYSFATTTKVKVNQGYGFGILSGLRVATGEYLGWTHADMQTDPFDVIRALDIIESKNNPKDIYVKGNRTGRSLFDQFFTVGMSFFELFCLKNFLWDINAQPNIFHRNFFEQWANPPHDFALDLYSFYMAKRLGLQMVRFKVVFSDRIHGASSWNTSLGSKYKFIKRTMDFSWSLKRGLRL